MKIKSVIDNKIPTTVKLDRDIYDEFKILCIRNKTKINLQVFINKCIHLYTTNKDFRFIVNNYNIPVISNPNKKVNLTNTTKTVSKEVPVEIPAIESTPVPQQEQIQPTQVDPVPETLQSNDLPDNPLINELIETVNSTQQDLSSSPTENIQSNNIQPQS